MFQGIGQIMGMMKNLPKLQALMGEMQEKMAKIVVEGNAGGGMVVVKANGRMEVTSCVISEQAMALNDRDMLADLIISATNMAIAKAREEMAKASANMAQEAGIPIPPGGLPGF